MPQPITVHLACNDPNNGVFTGRCEKIELYIGDECAAELDCGTWPESRFPRLSWIPGNVMFPDRFRLSRRAFKIKRYKSYSGNWCWDECSMDASEVARLLNYLQDLKWHNEGGFCDVGDHWDRGEKFRPSDIARLAMTKEEFIQRKRERGVATNYQPPPGIFPTGSAE